MAVTYGYFNSINGDRKYNADQMSDYFRGIVNEGVFQHLNGGLAVVAGTGMEVTVATGRAIVQNKWVQNDAAFPLTIEAASDTYGRKDAVVIRLSYTNRAISIAVKTGTPSASPAAPSLTRSSTTYEMALAYVNVSAGATSVTVTDKRSDTTVCGWATVAQETSGEVDAMLEAMKTGFDWVVYDSPAEMVRGSDTILYNVLKDSGLFKIMDLSEGTAGFVNTYGEVRQSDGWHYLIFAVNRGDLIQLHSQGYSNQVSMIGRYNSGTYTNKVASIDNTKRLYQYVADYDGFAYVSYYPANDSDLSVTMSAKGTTVNRIEVGTGKQYTSLIDAVNSISDASAINQYEIYLYEGTYNTIDPSAIGSSYYGLIIPDYVSIIGVGSRDSIIITAECPSDKLSYANNISTLNFRDNGRLENVTVVAKNLRYCNHDDYMTNNQLIVEHKYVNVKFVMQAIDGADVVGACVGIGAMYDKKIEFIRCDFENANTSSNNHVCILAHDNDGINGLRMVVKSCKIMGGRHAFNVATNTGSLTNIIDIVGNKIEKPVYVRNSNSLANKFKIRAWANSRFVISLGGTLTDISDDVEAYANESTT